MKIIHAEMTFGSEGELQKFLSHAQRLVAATRREKGCIEYTHARDITDPKRLCVMERWADEAAIEAHIRAPHVKDLFGLIKTLDIKPMSARMYDASREQELKLPD